MTNDEEGLVEIIMGVLEKHDIDHFKAIEINDEIINTLPKLFTFESLNLDIDLGDVKVISDNTNINTIVTIGNHKEKLNNIASIRWGLDASDGYGTLDIKILGFGRNIKTNKDE